ncbi:MAG: HAD-IA family hydrolase [Candidatus Krumholzibacteriia bacterium]
MPQLPASSAPVGILFDLDGTLVDSRADLAAAANAVRRAWGRPPLSDPVVAGYVGDGARALLTRVLTHVDDPASPPASPGAEVLDRAYEVFREHYAAHLLDRTVLYPGIADLLAALAGRSLLVVTNKPREFTLPILAGLGVLDRFAAVVAGDDVVRRKPNPDHLRAAIEAVGLPVGSCVMVGDSPNDVVAARKLGMASVAVTWGLVAAATLRAAGPDQVATTVPELADALQASA